MKLRLQFSLVLVLMFAMAGCASKGTNQVADNQYKAAVISNDFAHALGQLQTEEYALFQSGTVSADGHKTFKQVARRLNETGKDADKFISGGDWNGALPLLESALEQLQGLTPAKLGIKNPTSQLLYSASLNAALATLEIKLYTAQENVIKHLEVTNGKSH